MIRNLCYRKLFAQLESFKLSGIPSHKSGKMKPEPGVPGQSSTVTYELTYRPEQAHLIQVSHVADLEHRLHKLETVLGASSEKVVQSSSPEFRTLLHFCYKSCVIMLYCMAYGTVCRPSRWAEAVILMIYT
jgi:hypothetical protein